MNVRTNCKKKNLKFYSCQPLLKAFLKRFNEILKEYIDHRNSHHSDVATHASESTRLSIRALASQQN